MKCGAKRIKCYAVALWWAWLVWAIIGLFASSPLRAQLSIGSGPGITPGTVYNIIVQGNGSTDNTAALNTSLATCKDVLMDNGSISGNVVFPTNCTPRPTLYISTALAIRGVPLLLGTTMVGIAQGWAGGGQVTITVYGSPPTCATTPAITATGSMGATSFTVSSNTPLAIGSYVGFSASGSGGPYKITGISGTTISINPATLAGHFSSSTVVCESPAPISVNVGNVLLSNLFVNAGTVELNGGNQPVAQIKINNCTFQSPTTPLVIDGAFELSLDGLDFIPESGAYSMQITNDNATFGSGIIEISHSTINGKGILINSNNFAAVLPSSIRLIQDTYESLTNGEGLVDINSSVANGGFNGLNLDHVTNADSGGTIYAVREVGASPRGINNVTIEDISGLYGATIANVNINGLVITGGAGYGVFALGPQQSYTWLPGDSIDSPGYVHGVGPPSFGTNLGVNQTASTWTGTGLTVTLTTAPDGSNTAGLLTYSSGSPNVSVLNSSVAVGVGDWIVCGVWAQSNSESYAVNSNGYGAVVGISGATVQAPFGGAPVTSFGIRNSISSRIGKQWVPIVNAFKVTAITSSPATYSMYLTVSNTFAEAYWKPWMVRIPAGRLSDEEVNRLARTTQ